LTRVSVSADGATPGSRSSTARRARALEDVLLPELSATLAELDARLEEVEQEEAIRVRQA
jgi:vacuolar-type H+-ATPase subunit D/Vma8